MPITEELKRIYASAPIADGYIETLEFSHSQFPFAGNVFYACNYWKQFIGLDDDDVTPLTFEPLPFTIKIPQKDSSGRQDMQIVFSNVNRTMIDALDAAISVATEPIATKYRVYLENGPNTENQIDPFELSITDVSIKEASVSATARRADILNKPFPAQLYRIDLFPGLDR